MTLYVGPLVGGAPVAPASLIPIPTGWLKQLAEDLISGAFSTFSQWVATGTVWLLHEAWAAMSATSQPVLAGSAFSAEYQVMALIGAATVLPLLALGVIQAVARQDPSGLLRTALLRLPMALLLTGVVVELVTLGLSFTDQASVALLSAGGSSAAHAFGNIEAALAPGAPGVYGFGELILVVVVALVSFLLWVELAVRSAAVAVAAMFLPLALAGLVWPATSHWARRLGETLAGLVLMKLVMAAALALAGGAMAAGAGGVSSIVEGVALLGLTAFAPFALFRLIPMLESGAVSHLEGARPAQAVRHQAWSLASDGARSLSDGVLGPRPGAVPSSTQAGVGGLLAGGATAGAATAGAATSAAAGAAAAGAGTAGSGAGSGGTGTSGGAGPGASAPQGRSSTKRGESGWASYIVERSQRSSGGTQ